MGPHEYSVIGHSRAAVGRHLGTVAATIASASAALAVVAFDIATRWGVAKWMPEALLFPVSAALVYPIAHKLFDAWAWRSRPVLSLLGIPDLNGRWRCAGRTLDSQGAVMYEWAGTLTIAQTWEKIRVYLDTGESCSRSVAASLVREPGRGYVLMYSYRNEPGVGTQELVPHVGYCELTFNERLNAAEGDYFNNKGRVTFGRMTLTKGAR